MPAILDATVSTIPTVDIPEVASENLTKFPTDDQFIGLYRHVDTGRMFALAVTEPNIYGRTHFLKNSKEAWEGTVKSFRETFEKV